MNENAEKWSCCRCTYLNFPSALKCIMCFCSKPSELIVNKFSNIYNIGLQEKFTNVTGKPHASPLEKWSCHMCTYLNYPKSLYCVQCRTHRLSITEQLKYLTITKQSTPSPPAASGGLSPNKEFCDKQPSCTCTVGCISPKQNFSSLECTNSTQKWQCKLCTYQNWPKSVKCTMCGVHKNHKVQVIQATSSNNNISILLSSKTTTEIQNDVEVIKKDKLLCKCNQSSEDVSLNKDNNSGKCEHLDTEFNKGRNEAKENAANVKKNISEGNEKSNLIASNQNNIMPSLPSPILAVRSEGNVMLNNYETERLLRHLRRRLREADWCWLNACIGVIEGNFAPVEAYLSSGGDPMRQLTGTDVKLLGRPSVFEEGHTLVHLAIRYGREDFLATIFSRIDGGISGLKRVPSYVAPDLAADIRRHIATSFKQRKGPFPCFFMPELVTFSIPAEVEEFPSAVQEQLFEELLDKEVQKQLEEDSPIINWSLEITDRLGSRLYALWNRTAGDCLLDSVLQATWGVFDRENILRTALTDSLSEATQLFYPRWKEYERWQACLLDYYVPEGQMLEEWAELICYASQPGSPLEQLHIFVIAHILRRPLIVYGVKNVKSFRGEDLGFARFEGVYLPLLWDPGSCWKSPIALGYTRGHFSALVPIEPDSPESLGARAIIDTGESQVVFLPLMTHNGKLLPVHFLTQLESGREETLLRQWLEVCVTEGGILVAQQHLTKKPLLMAQMIEEWLNHYRRLAQMDRPPFSHLSATTNYSSDGDSDEE